MKLAKDKLFAVLLVVFLGLTFWQNRHLYLADYDARYWAQRYEKSQWNRGWEADQQMSDADLYAYAGWVAVHQANPNKIVPEAPPLGKYFFGLSILLFNNPRLVSLVFGGLLLLVVYLWAKTLVNRGFFIFLPVILVAADPLFRENLVTTMHDLPLAVFIGFAFYFLFKASKNPRFYFPAVVFLALTAATKMFFVGFALLAAFTLWVVALKLLFRRPGLKHWVLFLPVFGLIYIGAYCGYFLTGHTLVDWLKYHWWVNQYAKVSVAGYPWGEILRILVFGHWRTWWAGSEVVRVPAWSLLWPAGALALATQVIPAVRQFFRRDFGLAVLILWPVSLLVMFSFSVPYPRYLLPALPALYLLLAGAFQSLARIVLGGRRPTGKDENEKNNGEE